MSTLLIRNGTIVTATDLYKGDVFVEGDRISTIGTALAMPADRTIDATGKYVLPGGIDVHTHLAYGNANAIVKEMAETARRRGDIVHQLKTGA